jgi:hypothetical protein
MMDTINELVGKLAYARQVEAVEAEAVKEIEAEIEAAYGKMLALRKKYLATAKADVADAEAAPRAAAVEAYANTGEKKVHPAVMVKEFVAMDYDPEQAKQYAFEHLPSALKLDAKKFEKVALVIPLDFVTIYTEPRATIASDLSAWPGPLPEDEGEK